jgi:hypothetical protein
VDSEHKITVLPDWTAIQNGSMTEGRIILREDTPQAYGAVISVRVASDRRSITLTTTMCGRELGNDFCSDPGPRSEDCSASVQPVVEPGIVLLSARFESGNLTVHGTEYQCLSWYAKEIPDWLALASDDIDPATGRVVVRPIKVEPNEGAQRDRRLWFTAPHQRLNTITIRPNWNAIQSGNMTGGQIILRESSDQARQVVVTVEVRQDRRSIRLCAPAGCPSEG